MEQNKSLSARIKRRNKQGFADVGSYCGVGPNHSYGDYTDPEQNGKKRDYTIAEKRKNKLGFRRLRDIFGRPYSRNKRALTKKYTDSHQKLS